MAGVCFKILHKRETDETRMDRFGRSFDKAGLKQVKVDLFVR